MQHSVSQKNEKELLFNKSLGLVWDHLRSAQMAITTLLPSLALQRDIEARRMRPALLLAVTPRSTERRRARRSLR